MKTFSNGKIAVFQSVLFKTNAAVIDLEDAVLLCDPNWLPKEVEAIQQYVATIQKHRPLYIIYTHSDFDHIIGSGAFPEATVIASEKFTKHPDKESVLKQIKQYDDLYYWERKYEPTYPKVDIIISEDAQQIQIGNSTCSFYLAPGHTPDGLFTVVESEGIFLAGDYLSNVEFPFIYDSYSSYKGTMNKVENIFNKYNFNLLIPGHGDCTQNKQEMNERLQFAINYLQRLPVEDDKLEKELQKNFKFYDGMKRTHEENKKIALLKHNKGPLKTKKD